MTHFSQPKIGNFNNIPSKIPICIGVTGHRDISPALIPSLEARLEEFFLDLARRFPETPVWLLTGLAEGADRIAAQTFLEFKKSKNFRSKTSSDTWELHTILPMQKVEYQKDFPNSILEFENLINQSSSIELVKPPEGSNRKSDELYRAECYENLAELLIRRSTIVLAIWDGVHLPLRGGTSHLVRSRLRDIRYQHDLIDIPDQYLGPVLHLTCSRSSTSPSDQGIKSQWLKPVSLRAQTEEIFDILDSINQFNKRSDIECTRASPELVIKTLVGPEIDISEIFNGNHREQLRLISVFNTADQLSFAREQKRRHTTKLIYAGAAAAALFLWTTLDGVLQNHMVFGYVFSLAAAAFWYRQIIKPDLSILSLDYRFLAEALRVQFYFNICHLEENKENMAKGEKKVANNSIPADALGKILSQHAREIFWIREALRPFSSRSLMPLSSKDRGRDGILSFWVNDQISYFMRIEARYVRQVSKLTKISVVFGFLGIVAAIAAFSHDMLAFRLAPFRHSVSITAAVLPAWAILLHSYIHVLALDEQAKNALRMQWVFHSARENINSPFLSAQQKRDHVVALGQEALVECANWLILRKSRPPSLPT